MNQIKNKVQLIGKLTSPPVITVLDNGKKKAEFPLVTEETFRNEHGEKVTESQLHPVIAWGKLADIAERWLTIDTEVALEGKLVYRTYTDKTGDQHYKGEVETHELLILTKKSS